MYLPPCPNERPNSVDQWPRHKHKTEVIIGTGYDDTLNSPLIVLFGRKDSSTNKLLKKETYVLSSNGAALQCGFHAIPYKHEKQRGTVQLLHTLQCLLQTSKKSKVNGSDLQMLSSFK